MRLADKIAIVVGAGQGPGEGLGNGRATALLFARNGAKVLAVDRNLDSAKETAAIATEDGGECVPFEADVTREATLQAAVEAAVKRWGRIDILHNNVGVSLAGGDASPLEITEDAFDRVSAINLRGTVMACKHTLPVMRQQRSGAIVNIASVAATIAFPSIAVYSGTKSAVDRMMRVAAMEAGKLGFGVRVNCIYPGLIPTDMGMQLANDIVKVGLAPDVNAAVGSVVGQTPLGRLAEVGDIGTAAVFLCSNDARFITGIGLPVDGGMGM